MEEGFYFTMKDKEWYDNTLFHLVGGTDHKANFQECMRLTHLNGVDVNVVEGFLILEDMKFDPNWTEKTQSELP